MMKFLKRLRCLFFGHEWHPFWTCDGGKAGGVCGAKCIKCGDSVNLLEAPRGE